MYEGWRGRWTWLGENGAEEDGVWSVPASKVVALPVEKDVGDLL